MSANSTQPVVLIIEDEPVLRSSMVRGLIKDTSIQVVGAATVAEARGLIASLRPAFIISDLDLPDGSGLEVLEQMDALGFWAPVLFASAYVPKYRPQIPTRPEIQVREKPIPLRELRKAVEQHVAVDADQPEQVTDGPFAAPDYVQLACICRRSVEVQMFRGDARVGRIAVKDGELIAAEAGDLTGPAAVAHLVYARELRARCVPLRWTVERNIRETWQTVLLEAARLHDEMNRDQLPSEDVDLDWTGTFEEESQGVPAKEDRDIPFVSAVLVDDPTDSKEELDSELEYVKAERRLRSFEQKKTAVGRALTEELRPAASREKLDPRSTKAGELEFNRLFDAGVEALLAKDFQRAFSCFLQADRFAPGDPRVRANLVRLRALGAKGAE